MSGNEKDVSREVSGKLSITKKRQGKMKRSGGKEYPCFFKIGNCNN